MLPSNVNLVHIVRDQHGPIFFEVLDSLTAAFQDIGIRVTKTVNGIASDSINVLVGATAFLSRETFKTVIKSNSRFIVFQMEALDETAGFAPYMSTYLEFLRSATQIWDYSQMNRPYLETRGCKNIYYIPLGFSRGIERIVPAAIKDIDVFFYGSTSDRRKSVLAAIAEKGPNVRVTFGIYGPDRDQLIARSKINLNLHQFQTPHLEQVRLSYLLNNRCFVISESAAENPFGNGLVFSDYDKLVDCCLAYLRPGMQADRDRIAQAGYANLQKIPFVQSIRAALSQLPT